MMDYEQFRKEYEKQHPASIPVQEHEISHYAGWVKWLALLMFASGALMSGVHTAPTVYDVIPQHKLITEGVRMFAAVFSFVSIELAILLSAYFMVRRAAKADLMFLLVSGGIAMVANVTSVFNVLGGHADAESVIKTVFFGLGAPTIAFMAGKLFVNIHSSTRILDKRARDKYRQESIAFDEAILDAWTDYQDRREQRPTGVQVDSSGHGQRSGRGYSRTADARRRVRKYFTAHPDVLDSDMGVRPIADEIGNVSKSTVASVRSEMQDERKALQNGKSEATHG